MVFSMERMPSSFFKANAIFFRIGCLAYNLFRIFQLNILPKGYKKYSLFKWKSLLFSSNFHSFSCQKYPFPKINRRFWGYIQIIALILINISCLAHKSHFYNKVQRLLASDVLIILIGWPW